MTSCRGFQRCRTSACSRGAQGAPRLKRRVGQTGSCARVQDDCPKESSKTWHGCFPPAYHDETLRVRMPPWVLATVNEAIQ
jgi:hypothetical protein